MKPGPTLVRACPSCGAHHRQVTLASGNTFGATFWSDGYLDAPMWHEPEKLSRCLDCGDFFWVDDAEVLGQLDDSSFQKEDLKVLPAESVSPDRGLPNLGPEALLEAIEEGLPSTADEEYYLRRLVWWKANHMVREAVKAGLSTSGMSQHSQGVTSNLLKLLAFFDGTEADERLARAELLRELGRFAEAIEELEATFDDVDHQRFASRIENLARQGVREVRPLSTDG